MSVSRTRSTAILEVNNGPLDNAIPIIEKFIRRYETSLDISQAKSSYHEQALSITFWLFVGPSYLDSLEYLDMNPAFRFLKAISEVQKPFSTLNDKIDRETNIQLPYMPRTFTMTNENAHGLAQEIEDHLRQNEMTADKKYFLAKLKYTLQHEKWLTKGVNGINKKVPKHITQLKNVFDETRFDENTAFDEVAAIIETTDALSFKGFSLFSLAFRDKEVNKLYATLKMQILSIQQREEEIALLPKTTLEMDSL